MHRRESGYYPPGAEFDSRAPWNQPEPEEIDVDVLVSTTISKSTSITTYDGVTITEKDFEEGENGKCYPVTTSHIDYSNCNFIKDYTESSYSVIQLLDILKEYVTKDLQEHPEESSRLNNILESASGWTEDELEVIKQ